MAQNPNLFNLNPEAYRLSKQRGAFKRLEKVGPEKIDARGISQAGTADAALELIRRNSARNAANLQSAVNLQVPAWRAAASTRNQAEGKLALSAASKATGAWWLNIPNWAVKASELEMKIDKEGAGLMDRIGGPVSDLLGEDSKLQQILRGGHEEIRDFAQGILGGVGGILDVFGGSSGPAPAELAAAFDETGRNSAAVLVKALREANPTASYEELLERAKPFVDNLRATAIPDKDEWTTTPLPGRDDSSRRPVDGSGPREIDRRRGPLIDTVKGEPRYATEYLIRTPATTAYNQMLAEQGRNKYGYGFDRTDPFMYAYLKQSIAQEELEKRKAAGQEATSQINAAREARAQEVESAAATTPATGAVTANLDLYSDDLNTIMQARRAK